MKFHQLPVGSRFRYQGETWCKSSPLAASGEGGGQRMIPRSATVEPLDAATAHPTRSPAQQALHAHHRVCRELLRAAADGGPEALAELNARLDAAHAALVAALD